MDATVLRRIMLKAWSDAATENAEQRPSMSVVDGSFVLTNTNRQTWFEIAQAASVPAHANQATDGDTLTCTWESHGDTYFEGLLGMERRPQQIHMARLIQRAVEMGECAIVEAPTGTGKSLAYLAPLMAMGKRIIVSTSNKALQSQLATKDIPFLRKALGGYTVSVAVGKSNYMCMAKVDDPRGDGIRDGNLAEWYESTETGNVEEIPFAADTSPWTVDDGCTGKHCALYNQCFYYRAKRERAAADIVICNHALLCQHAAMPYAGLLPDADVIVIDEAHAFPAYARGALGVNVNARQIADNALLAALRSGDPEPELVNVVASKLRANADEIWPTGLAPTNNDEAKLEAKAKRLERLADKLAAWSEPPAGVVRWVERGAQIELRTAPIDIAQLVRALRGERNTPIVFASATLASPSLDMFAEMVGVDGLQYQASSPFDYKANALVYVPVKERGANEEIADLVEASGGGAFLLFTANNRLNDAYNALADVFRRRGMTVYRQGELGRHEIAKRFAADGNAVLFATRTFFEGVDIPGDALRLVVIDRLPFEPPTVLSEAIGRVRRMAWLSDMLIALKQATGRLIRTRTDRGVIAVLDTRVRTQGYGKAVLSCLPPAPVTASMEHVCSFYRNDYR